MSNSSARHEGHRWLGTARQDLAAAQSLLDTGHYAQACFLSQQAAEKAIKGLWYSIDADPWGHSIQKLLTELPGCPTISADEHLKRLGAKLDRLYIPTRYPNGIPDLTPGETYCDDDAREAIQDAETVIQVVSDAIPSTDDD